MDVVATQSTEQRNGLPDAWVERLFQRLLALYGTEKFTSVWRGQDMAEVKALWSSELAGYTADEVRVGLDSLRRAHPTWPPTLFEFAELCRPTAFDHESAFAEAVKGIYARRDGKPGEWSHRAIYWAVQDVSAHDVLNATWPQIRSRWKKMLDRRLADPNLPAIPEVPKALPEPPRDPAKAVQVEQIVAVANETKRDPRAWAKRILERKASGLPVSDIAYRMAVDSENVR